MDALNKLIDLASKLNVPGLVQTGLVVATQVREYADEVKAAAERAKHVLSDGERAELDAIHAEALAAADALDAKLAAAERR